MGVYHVDIQYLKLLPLEQFEDMGNGRYNFRCPVCGDSYKNLSKKRGWATDQCGNIHINCFNCGYSKPFGFFLQYQFPEFYNDYKKDCIMEGGSFGFGFGARRQNVPQKSDLDLFAVEYDTLDLMRLGDLPETHRAVRYMKERRYKRSQYSGLYYTDNFMEWAHNKQPNLFTKPINEDKRIIIPFYTKRKKIFMVSARTITNQNPKYLSLKFDENHPKIFGLDTVDSSKTVLVTEGPLDAMMLPNTIAMGGAVANLDKLLDFFVKEQLVIIGDNEKRNKNTCDFMETALKRGFRVVIFPQSFPYKDINAAIQGGVSKIEMLTIIRENVYKGLKGLVKLTTWKR